MTVHSSVLLVPGSLLLATALLGAGCSSGPSCADDRTCASGSRDAGRASASPARDSGESRETGGTSGDRPDGGSLVAARAAGGAGGVGAAATGADADAKGGSAAHADAAPAGEGARREDGGALDAASPTAASDAGSGPDGGMDAAPEAAPPPPPPPPDPCLACDPRAACAVSAGVATCTCPQGYAGDGRSCVRDLCQPLPGEPEPCGAQATCKASAASVSCQCVAGYASCDGAADPSPGCERNLLTDWQNCGACGFKCANSWCSAGSCEPVVTRISAGLNTTCVELPPATGALGGKVKCWGTNVGGLLGDATLPPGAVRAAPVAVPALGDVRDLAVGGGHACALAAASDGVLCWGANGSYELGTTGGVSPGQVVTTVVPGAAEVAVAASSTCVRTQTGGVSCWGSSSESGTGPSGGMATVVVGFNALRLFGGPMGYCAIGAKGGVACWGTGSFQQSPTAIHNADGTPVVDGAAVSIGSNSYCLLRKGGTVDCAGNNSYGQLGLGTVDSATHLLSAVPGLSGVVELQGPYLHTCARTAAGTLYCWGLAQQGQLGIGTDLGSTVVGGTVHVVPTATQVPRLTGVLEVATGYVHTCVRLATSQVECFGDNQKAQLGDGTQSQQVSPTRVLQLP